MTYGVDLGSVTTTADADADVDLSEFVEADGKEGFVDLWPGLDVWFWWFEVPDGGCRGRFTLKRRISGWTRESGLPFTLTMPLPAWRTIVRQDTGSGAPGLKVPCNVRQRLLMAMSACEFADNVDRCTCLLLAEALDHLRGSHDCGWIGAVDVW